MKLTDEQYRAIGLAINDTDGVAIGSFIPAGCAAYEAVRPLVLAEAQRDIAAYLLDVHGWNVSDAIYAGQKVFDRLTAPPVDPAVEAVKTLIEHLYPQGNYNVRDSIRMMNVNQIVAAVRAADRKKDSNG